MANTEKTAIDTIWPVLKDFIVPIVTGAVGYWFGTRIETHKLVQSEIQKAGKQSCCDFQNFHDANREFERFYTKTFGHIKRWEDAYNYYTKRPIMFSDIPSNMQLWHDLQDKLKNSLREARP